MVRNFIVCMTVLLAAVSAEGAGLERLRALAGLPYQQRGPAVAALLRDHPTNPLVEAAGDTLTLLYHGPGRDVRLAGDHTAWDAALAFRHVPGTALWFLARAYAPASRLDYKLVVDGQWQLDPRNPYTCTGGFGPNSELRGAAYTPPDWLDRPATAPCTLDTFTVAGPRLGDTRKVVVAVPGGPADGRRPLLIVHDGLEYLTLGGLRRYLDVLGGEAIGPRLPICVCVPPVQRTAEYAESRQEAFGRFVVETVMPLIAERYADIAATDEPWGSMGASYGGRITLDLARRYPGMFDRLAPMSPSIAPEQHDGIAALDPASLKIYLNWGSEDLPGLIPGCMKFEQMLNDRGFPHTTEILPQGHSWGLWRDTLDAAFQTLYNP